MTSVVEVSSRPLRIAISGAVSTDKTTLGKALSERLHLAFIEENLESVFVIPQTRRGDTKFRAERVLQSLEAKRENSG
jgi:shikimate kinase